MQLDINEDDLFNPKSKTDKIPYNQKLLAESPLTSCFESNDCC